MADTKLEHGYDDHCSTSCNRACLSSSLAAGGARCGVMRPVGKGKLDGVAAIGADSSRLAAFAEFRHDEGAVEWLWKLETQSKERKHNLNTTSAFSGRTLHHLLPSISTGRSFGAIQKTPAKSEALAVSS